jgi:SpoVK/Ycf46/Vps4 family AAA+-type ATPase
MPLHAPGSEASCYAWQSFASQEGLALSRDTAKTLSGRLKLTSRQIHHAVRSARCHAAERGAEEPVLNDFMAAARAHSGQNLSLLARKVNVRQGWDDIVLPEDTTAQLREMCQRVEHRRQVLEDWGFERKLSMGKGVNALFSGPSGSGKTMAAEVVATELQLDLYKIDLSGVVSKYIGETEKNLDRIFNAAENSNAILFFDEADALFGKRSEVRDSHDRYANIEISYLLQKMEEYSGIAILATNLRQNLDDAFYRRLTFSLHFPFPDEAARARIWEGIWPAGTPLAADFDAGLLARRVKLSGGNIRNIALAAAFLAAEQGTAVATEHVLHAVRREYQKFGKQLEIADLQMESIQRAAS